MAQLVPQQVTTAGLAASFVAAAVGGDKALPGATSILRVKNDGVGSINVTLDSVALSNFGTDVNVVVAVAAGAEKDILLSPASRFAGPDGMVSIAYSGVTDVTVANIYS